MLPFQAQTTDGVRDGRGSVNPKFHGVSLGSILVSGLFLAIALVILVDDFATVMGIAFAYAALGTLIDGAIDAILRGLASLTPRED